MRWCAVTLWLCLAGASWAGERVLVPENNPKPEYPTALNRAGIMGAVKASFTVHTDGRVDEITILHSDHPEFTEAVRGALVEWRFQPWTADDEHSAQVRVVAPFEFRLDDTPIDANKWIKTWRCSDINAYASDRLQVRDLLPFHYTRSYLSNVFFVRQLPEAERLALIARFNRLLPSIVQRCGRLPATRYMRMLPKEIRELL